MLKQHQIDSVLQSKKHLLAEIAYEEDIVKYKNITHTGSGTSINVFSLIYFNCSAKVRQVGLAVSHGYLGSKTLFFILRDKVPFLRHGYFCFLFLLARILIYIS